MKQSPGQLRSEETLRSKSSLVHDQTLICHFSDFILYYYLLQTHDSEYAVALWKSSICIHECARLLQIKHAFFPQLPIKAWMKEMSEDGTFEWLSQMEEGFQVSHSADWLMNVTSLKSLKQSDSCSLWRKRSKDIHPFIHVTFIPRSHVERQC